MALNLTRGGGYTPHKADETLAKNYGDCKDKATLMRALLKAQGIDSWLLVITANDRNYVRPEWASPAQFSHAIVAIRVPADFAGGVTVDSARLGRLLMFDPTDSITPLGDLPRDEQGSYALVIAGDAGELIKMPALAPEAGRVESSSEGTIDALGGLTVSLKRSYFGQAARPLRSAQRAMNGDEMKKLFERGLSEDLPGMKLAKLDVAAKPASNEVDADFDMTVPRFGQSMQGRLFIVRPGDAGAWEQLFIRHQTAHSADPA